MGASRGRLLRHLIQGPLYWLGMVELSAATDAARAAYRLAPRALAWLGDEPPPADEVRVPLIVQPEGALLVPHKRQPPRALPGAAHRRPGAVHARQALPLPYRAVVAGSGASRHRAGADAEVLETASGRPRPPAFAAASPAGRSTAWRGGSSRRRPCASGTRPS
ncbi:MAG: hypothetical protein IPH95_08470 [Candidatus Promineofilum sp.]|nr:hypothetical protein [Promineifilum sp.]